MTLLIKINTIMSIICRLDYCYKQRRHDVDIRSTVDTVFRLGSADSMMHPDT